MANEKEKITANYNRIVSIKKLLKLISPSSKSRKLKALKDEKSKLKQEIVELSE